MICSDLSSIPLSRAAAASSAVPVVMSPVTLDNYGGRCNYQLPLWARQLVESNANARPSARVRQRIKEVQAFADSRGKPYIHLVDGGISDNLGLRGVLDILDAYEALRAMGQPTPLDRVRRIVIFAVDAGSSPQLDWDASVDPPGSLALLLHAAGVPIDRYSVDTLDLLYDVVDRWNVMRRIEASGALHGTQDATLTPLTHAPQIAVYLITVAFDALGDARERAYLAGLPTTLALPAAAVDRLRSAAATIVEQSADFQRLLRDVAAELEPTGPPR